MIFHRISAHINKLTVGQYDNEYETSHGGTIEVSEPGGDVIQFDVPRGTTSFVISRADLLRALGADFNVQGAGC